MSDMIMNTARIERDEKGIYLTDGELALRVDFCEMKDRIRQANLERELLIKAVAVKGYKERLKVLDATAGLGEDSFLLAASGCEVYMYEQDDVIATLLEDGINRAKKPDDPDIPTEIRDPALRLHFTRGDSINAMRDFWHGVETGSGAASEDKAQGRLFDVIYLDPMFPERRKSAAVKKKFQLLQQLERPEMRERELLEGAMLLKPRKVVIKRPVKGPFLCGIKPEYSVKGNSVRYDIVIPR